MPGKVDKDETVKQVIDVILKVGILALLVFLCYIIMKPFLSIVLWSSFIAITVYPFYIHILARVGDRKKLAAIIVTLSLLGILVIPGFVLTESLIDGIRHLNTEIGSKGIDISPPPEEIREWPVIGNWLFSTWELASESLRPIVEKHREALIQAAQKFLGLILNTGIGMLQILLSIILSGFILVNSTRLEKYMRILVGKIAGDRGDEYTDLITLTIRNISKGVLGVAIIQSTLLGLLFFFAGIPYAGLWALICLILAIIQIGPFLVTIPVIIYLFLTLSTGAAVVWTILIIAGTLLDNFLKPIFMGQGASVPMLVIFLGAIGGLMAGGFVGLFLGAIGISLAYKLLLYWLAA